MATENKEQDLTELHAQLREGKAQNAWKESGAEGELEFAPLSESAQKTLDALGAGAVSDEAVALLIGEAIQRRDGR